MANNNNTNTNSTTTTATSTNVNNNAEKIVKTISFLAFMSGLERHNFDPRDPQTIFSNSPKLDKDLLSPLVKHMVEYASYVGEILKKGRKGITEDGTECLYAVEVKDGLDESWYNCGLLAIEVKLNFTSLKEECTPEVLAKAVGSQMAKPGFEPDRQLVALYLPNTDWKCPSLALDSMKGKIAKDTEHWCVYLREGECRPYVDDNFQIVKDNLMFPEHEAYYYIKKNSICQAAINFEREWQEKYGKISSSANGEEVAVAAKSKKFRAQTRKDSLGTIGDNIQKVGK